MTASRYDLMVGRKYKTSSGEEKTQWTRVGVMFPSKKGDGFSLTLEALPLILDDKGGVRIQAFPPKPRDGRGGSGGGSRQGSGSYPDEDYGAGADDDSIPF